jgi:hypothetical protein
MIGFKNTLGKRKLMAVIKYQFNNSNKAIIITKGKRLRFLFMVEKYGQI